MRVLDERKVAWLAAASAALGAACLVWWFSVTPEFDLAVRVATEAEARTAAQADAVNLVGEFLAFGGVPSALGGSWPRFRGAGFDNIGSEDVGLAEAWGEGGPPVLWSVELGEGHAGPAVFGGRVYVLDYDEERQGDALRCFSLDDGGEIWRRWYKVRTKRNHGMSRTVPAVTEKYVVTMGPKCHVMCVDAATGDFKWGMDLVRDFGATVPLWYTGQCPLIDGETAVIAVGGEALVVGVDCETGEILWETPNGRGWKMSHSSVMEMRFAGRKMYVYAGIGGVVGVSAEGDDAGRVLWETEGWSFPVVSPSPVVLDGGRVFLTAGYGAGSVMLQLAEREGGFSAEVVYRLDKTEFACEQQTPICYEGHLYTVLPNDGGAVKRQLACMTPEGERLWTSGKESRFGLGPFLVGDGKIFVLSDDGTLTLARATGEGYQQLAQARVIEGHDAWAPMALVEGRLLLRDRDRMVCLDVRGD